MVAGTALPDWMNVIDRKNRARRQYALPVLQDPDFQVAEFAAGVLQHHDDDDWFHRRQPFILLSSQFSVELRGQLAEGLSHQAAFLGHISVELLLDAALIHRDPQLLQRYYQLLAELDLDLVQISADRVLKRPASLLSWLIPRFLEERFLGDYSTDSGLLYRLGGVMRRVGLPPLPDLTGWLSTARRRVYQQADQLLPPEPQ